MRNCIYCGESLSTGEWPESYRVKKIYSHLECNRKAARTHSHRRRASILMPDGSIRDVCGTSGSVYKARRNDWPIEFYHTACCIVPQKHIRLEPIEERGQSAPRLDHPKINEVERKMRLRYSRTDRVVDKDRSGFVYIAQGEDLKVGRTRINPHKRAATANTFLRPDRRVEIVWMEWVSDCHAAEELIHQRLEESRYPGTNEVFRVTLDEALEVCVDVCSNFLTQGDKHAA